MQDSLPSVNKDIVFRQEEEEALLFNPDTGMIKVLNPMGIFIWKLCDGKHNRIDIIREILERYEGESKEKIEMDVDNFLDDLKNNNLLSFKDDSG